MTDHIPDVGKMVPARCEPPDHLRGVDGWHWVQFGPWAPRFAEWQAAPYGGSSQPLWKDYERQQSCTPKWAAEEWGWRYLSPVATPAEVEAMRAEVMRAGAECADAMSQVVALRARVAELEKVLDFYACVDHYPTHGAEAPDVVRNDQGRRARAALDGKNDG